MVILVSALHCCMAQEARTLVDDYFAALSAADLPRILSFLHEDVKVGFVDESRNWRGKATAQEKFGLMYSRSPGFRVVAYAITEEHIEGSIVSLLVEVTFESDGKPAWDSVLFYEIDHVDRVILSIEHR